MPEAQAGSKTIRATRERLRQKGVNWVIIRLPFSVEKLWKTRGIVRVNVEVNGFNYRTAIFPTRSGQHFLVVNKKMQKAGRIAPGGTGVFTLTPDFSARTIQLPQELEAALNEDRALRKWFDRLSYSTRKWLVEPVADAKSPATRRRRAQRVAENVMEAMDAYHDLPPTIRLAFARHPGAELAWQRLTETQRRHNLVAIFFYRTPESRMRRIEILIEQTLKIDGPETM
jgi:uncharacterized protein YdeI (YjbR/CyaY-like superfamily)